MNIDNDNNTKEELANNVNPVDGNTKGNKKSRIISFIPYFFIIAIIIVTAMIVFPNFFFGNGKTENETNQNKPTTPEKPVEPEKPIVSKFKIYDTTSKKRPYALAVNNTPVAVKVQEGLNNAYIVYEIPTEGFTSRLLAVYKDAPDVTVGTLRSCRHNFMDYAKDSDAIIVCFGWSHYAFDEFHKKGSDFMNGNESYWASAFWRSNPEKLAREHTAYTKISNIDKFTSSHNYYRLDSDISQFLNYSQSEINLDKIEGNKEANSVKLPYGSVTTTFKYDKNTKMYTRIVNGTVAKDYKTKEPFTTKNIIIVKVEYNVMPDNYYWNLKTTGTGKGYYITNGRYVPITWKKDERNSQSKYYYQDGREIEVNDGRTYIEVHITSKSVSIS